MSLAGEPEELATALANMARDLLAQESVQETLDRIVAHSVELVDGCDGAGVLTIRSGQIRTLAATDEVARRSDEAQAEFGEGPCLDAELRERQHYRLGDLATAGDRWPRYAAKARELGIGSAMGFLLYTEEENLGALNLYAKRPDAFTERSEHVGRLLASHAAVAFASARSDAQLHQAIASRQDIGEALGIVMERFKLTERQAFQVLRKASQDKNIKLRDLAREVTETGEI